MIQKALAKVFGTSNEREIKRISPIVGQVNAFASQMQQLSDEQLRAKTDEFRQRIRERLDGIEDETERLAARKAVLDELLPEAFAPIVGAFTRVLLLMFPTLFRAESAPDYYPRSLGPFVQLTVVSLG